MSNRDAREPSRNQIISMLSTKIIEICQLSSLPVVSVMRMKDMIQKNISWYRNLNKNYNKNGE